MKKLTSLLIFFCLFSSYGYSQDCDTLHQWDGCQQKIRNFSSYLEPIGNAIGLNDTLKYNIVFEGGRDYMISFCAPQLYYPLHIRLCKQETNEEIYDNARDGYCEFIGLGFFTTQNIIIEVIMLADNIDRENIKPEEKFCIGTVINWKNIPSKIKSRSK